MRLEGLDLNLLVALDAILEERSVIGASRRLRLSQPAMSAAVSRLRQYFNDDIFTISRRKLVPTPLAQSLKGPTRDVLLRIRASVITAPRFEPEKSHRRFRLVVSDYTSIVLMQPVMRRISSIAPDVSLELRPFNDHLGDQLQRGELDFVIQPEGNRSGIDGHPKQRLFSDEFCCVAWAENKKIGRSLSIQRYLQLGHVTAQFGPISGAVFEERALLKQGYKRRIEVIASNFTTMATMVIGTDRIATMHERLAVFLAQNFPLRLLPAPVRIPTIQVNLHWPTHFNFDPGLVWLRDIIFDIASGIDRTPPKTRVSLY